MYPQINISNKNYFLFVTNPYTNESLKGFNH